MSDRTRVNDAENIQVEPGRAGGVAKRLAAPVAAGLSVGLALAIVVLSADDFGDDTAGAASSASDDTLESEIRITRSDGSTYTFSEFDAKCESDDAGNSELLVQTPLIASDDSEALEQPYLRLVVQVDDVNSRRAYPMPTPEKVPTSHKVFTLFVADGAEALEPNETSSAEADAGGSLQFAQASCEQGQPTLNAVVRGQLGSEVGGSALSVEGLIYIQ